MLYETAARAAEILALNVEDLDLEHRRAPVRSKGGTIEWVYWDSGTAHLLPRLPDGSTRTRGPLFLSERRPVPARRPVISARKERSQVPLFAGSRAVGHRIPGPPSRPLPPAPPRQNPVGARP
ncbi:hypothetical protein [Nonomuraea bangladeshensis]|uniref:hypothetical protein n=1 Tax=Nonomuraea bangladeshensis TaxID=404385 RepID=UPI003C2F4F07